MADDLLFRTFYRAIKARTMMYDEAVPIQILQRDTIDRPDDKGRATRRAHGTLRPRSIIRPEEFRGGLPIFRETSVLSGFPSIT
jgi:hypothetical protein